MLDLLLSKSARMLVMSGILGEQEPMITSVLNERGIHDHHIERLGEWISVTVTI